LEFLRKTIWKHFSSIETKKSPTYTKPSRLSIRHDEQRNDQVYGFPEEKILEEICINRIFHLRAVRPQTYGFPAEHDKFRDIADITKGAKFHVDQ
jgi:hypothetical protein